ncbi:Gfo/Idh/MocA family protein [Occallatibacter riparius]|uniref:Gfo/Idh/MocA family oxidoreductase n=1 Tax=Occallatibacter riparius TaxID=1002689 RepID=A0A9J7BNM8_9BACT|nr:Gfo/Idh/MocA family oxidoreductase [Occallatibacter riparius]UWZ84328.1 Gfo/Idh/MocA family oxidoreductase [Occallatibacter riparius]
MPKSLLSRRAFLHTTAAAAAGVTLAGKSIEIEAEPNYTAFGYSAPSDRIRFGMVGIGMEGSSVLATACALPGTECVAAADLYDGRHTLAREIVGKPIKTTRRYQELLDDKSIDAILIAVPDHWHMQVVVDALAAGKDVYCEKPMSHTSADGLAMVAAAQKTDRIVQIGPSAPVRSCAGRRTS